MYSPNPILCKHFVAQVFHIVSRIRSSNMFYKTTHFVILFFIIVFSAGCHVLLSEQEWSENYAQLDGAKATSPQMIDGKLETVGETQPFSGPKGIYRMNAGSEVIITLPEKKSIRKIVIHSDNVKKFNLYADKGGTALSETDWQLIKELKNVKSYPLEVPILYAFPTDRLRLVVLDTSDDASLWRKEKAKMYTNPNQMMQNFFGGISGFRRSSTGRISEIEIYGYKTAAETAAAKSDPMREDELDAILE